MVSTLFTRDGRALTYAQHGDPAGRPVFVMHGTPGSRIGPIPRASRLYPQGVRLIAYDRPGYGGSDRLPGRAVGHAASDVVELADALKIERFAVVGRSGAHRTPWPARRCCPSASPASPRSSPARRTR